MGFASVKGDMGVSITERDSRESIEQGVEP